jgi:hypothetical protein
MVLSLAYRHVERWARLAAVQPAGPIAASVVPTGDAARRDEPRKD